MLCLPFKLEVGPSPGSLPSPATVLTLVSLHSSSLTPQQISDPIFTLSVMGKPSANLVTRLDIGYQDEDLLYTTVKSLWDLPQVRRLKVG